LLVLAGLRDSDRYPGKRKVLGPAFQRGLDEGRHEGRQEGIQQGRQEGELELLRRMIEKRFGRVPAAVEERLAKLTAGELEALGVTLLEAASLEELFR
jgi:flagellar biosynthesis/type III secretory pathway protein FliH